MLTLADLLAEPTLGLVQRAGPPDASERAVLGAAVVEVESPARWIAPGWVLLTAGVRLAGSADGELRALVADCAQAGVAALGFGIGPVFDELPAPLLDEAAERDYPVFAIPRDTAFRDVVRHVDAAIMGDEAPLFRRLGSLQRYVADGLREPDAERAVVERLARFIDASVAVLAPDGTPSRCVGKAPFPALFEHIAGRSPAVVEAEAEGWCAVAAPLAAGAEDAHGWLVLASPRSHFGGVFVKRAAEVTAPLLVAMDQLKAVARAQELAERAALLEEALRGGDAAALGARAAIFGLDFSAPVRVLLVRDASTLAGRPHVLSGDVALVQGDVAGIAAQGIGRAIDSIAGVPVSLRDAQLAAAGGVAAFEDLDLATLLLGEADPQRLEPRVERIVSILRENPPLHEALVAYFAHDLDVPATAAELHLHPNSLRYRLQRLEELLGCSLKRPATIAELHIALLADPRTRDARF
jgi:purine catabolism regulator